MAVKKPYKFTANKRAEFLQLLSEGSRRGAAAESCGVTRQTVVTAMRDDPDFAAAVDEAEMAANELVEDALFQAASSGNVVACQVWLYNRAPDRWADKRRVDANINIKDIDDAIEAELALLAAGGEGAVPSSPPTADGSSENE